MIAKYILRALVACFILATFCVNVMLLLAYFDMVPKYIIYIGMLGDAAYLGIMLSNFEKLVDNVRDLLRVICNKVY